MNLFNRIIIYTVVLCILYWVLDAVISYLLFFKDLSIVQVLITNPPIETLYTRMLGLAALVILGLLVIGMLRLDKGFQGVSAKRGKDTKKLSHIPNLLIDLSHQIKTPLNAIVGFSDLLKNPELSPESKRLYVNHISTSGKYLFELVNNVTDIVKIETEQLRVNKSECQINKLLNEIHSKFEEQLKGKNRTKIDLVLKTGIEDENFTLLTDQEKLKQILNNLLENAVSLTDDGYIEFGYRHKDDLFLEFYVKDTGVGLNMERLEMIMEHFHKVIDKRMQPFDLAALRINISKHLVNLLGGKLEAESELWHGSTFTFTLPLNEIKVRKKEDPEKDDEKRGDTNIWNEKQILIAEDVESNFIYLREILRPTRIQLHWAKNGKEAVDIFKKNKKIDLVLMDILMPEMDGYEAAKQIKEKNKDVPIVVQTAYSLDNETEETLSCFDEFLVKPIWSNDLIRVLYKFLK